jgi:hypothetical protein
MRSASGLPSGPRANISGFNYSPFLVKREEGFKNPMPNPGQKIICGYLKRNGEPCRTNPVGDGTGHCYWHSEKVDPNERMAAAVRGGLHATHQRTLAKIESRTSLSSERAARRLLEQTIDDVRLGRITPNIANSVAQLVATAIKLGELRLTSELARLERELKSIR